MDFEHSERAQQYIEHVDRFMRERVTAERAALLPTARPHRRLAAVAHPAHPRDAEGRGQGRRAVEPLPARQRVRRRASTTATMRRWPRSWAAASSRPRSSTAARPTPATPRCWCATAATSRRRAGSARFSTARSAPAFAMTEPAVASSDATNMQATCEVVGDEIVINGQKWWTSGAGDPRCKFLIFMGVTDPHGRAPPAPLDGDRADRRPRADDPAHGAGVRAPRRAARPRRDRLRRRARAEGPLHRGPRTRLRDRTGPPRPGTHPPLHARDRRGRARPRAALPARRRPHRLRQAARQPRRQPRHHRQLPHGHRPGPAAHAEGRVGARHVTARSAR